MHSLAFILANVAYGVPPLYWLIYIFDMYKIPLLYCPSFREVYDQANSLYTGTQFVERKIDQCHGRNDRKHPWADSIRSGCSDPTYVCASLPEVNPDRYSTVTVETEMTRQNE